MPNQNDKVHQIDSLVQLFTDYEGFSGAVLVAHEGKVLYKKGFGFANRTWDLPNTTTTKFKIASLSKSFTAMLIMQLVEDGKLDLQQPIAEYLPNYPKPQADEITIHHLLTHSSGLLRDISEDTKHLRTEAIVTAFSERPLEFEPGTKFQYSNAGYTLLGYLIETITGNSYEEVLQTRIFKPLGMTNSGYFRPQPLIKEMASGYFKSFGDYYNVSDFKEQSAYAAGGIYSTVEDLMLWEKALNNNTLLSERYTKLLFSKHMADPGYGGHYAYGWEVLPKPLGNSSETVETIGHSGSIPGFCALYTRIPKRNSCIIFLNNTQRAYLNTMTTAISGILYDKPYDFPKKPLAKFMTMAINKHGIDSGIVFYKDHQSDPDYYINETELIVEGYRFLHEGAPKMAAEIFKLSTEVFPDKDNPYDSYAEALLVLGDTTASIRNYQKSLDINPNNRNAIKILEKLMK